MIDPSPIVEVMLVVFANVFVAWLVTYLVHSTLMIAASWSLTRVLRPAPIDEVRMWRFVLVAPFVTAALHAWGGAPASMDLTAVAPAALADWRVGILLLTPLAFLPALLVYSWVQNRIALRRAFGKRRRPPGEFQRLANDLAKICRCHRPYVSQSARSTVPAAIGLREICIPSHVGSLPFDEQRALIAHELGHIAHRDPIWFAALGALTWATPFQPLNRIALQRLRNASERAADDFAVTATGDRVALASALTAIVATLVMPPSAAAATGSPIVERVGRILAPKRTTAALASRAVRVSLAASIVAAVLWLPVGVSASPDDSANRIPWLTPSRDKPNERMLEVRRFFQQWL